MTKFIRIPAPEMEDCFTRILTGYGFNNEKALSCARIFTGNSLEGVASHGVNRFYHFVDYLKRGIIHADAEPRKIASAGNLEQWDGQLGPGPLNALFAAERSMEIAEGSGIGMVALSRTNHWMRGGTYGRHCARKGFAFIGWTNTIANLPAWGARENKLGNNPLVIAVPRQPDPVVLDMAMSQFSYGKMHETANRGEELPLYGGYDLSGKITKNPAEILRSKRPLPIGYWKGSSLALILDILAAILSAGLPTAEITRQSKYEYGVSQIFTAINLKKLSNYPLIEQSLNRILADFLSAESGSGETELKFPGQFTSQIRKENEENGIPVHPAVWQKIQSLI